MPPSINLQDDAGQDVAAAFAALLNAADHVKAFLSWFRGYKGRKGRWAEAVEDDFAGIPWVLTAAADNIRDQAFDDLTESQVDERRKLVAVRFDPAAADARPRRHYIDVLAELGHCGDLLAETKAKYQGTKSGMVEAIMEQIDGAGWVIQLAIGCPLNDVSQEEKDAAAARLEARLGVAESAPA